MKIVVMIARILLGLVFLVFGANKLYQFMPMGPMPPGVAGQFVGALFATKYIVAVGLIEAVGGLLLLFNRYVPLGLVLLAPVIVNILLTDILMTHSGLPVGTIVTILWLVVYMSVRSHFKGLYAARSAQ
jgi:putative oxidoreductase